MRLPAPSPVIRAGLHAFTQRGHSFAMCDEYCYRAMPRADRRGSPGWVTYAGVPRVRAGCGGLRRLRVRRRSGFERRTGDDGDLEGWAGAAPARCRSGGDDGHRRGGACTVRRRAERRACVGAGASGEPVPDHGRRRQRGGRGLAGYGGCAPTFSVRPAFHDRFRRRGIGSLASGRREQQRWRAGVEKRHRSFNGWSMFARRLGRCGYGGLHLVMGRRRREGHRIPLTISGAPGHRTPRLPTDTSRR
jgi:hypothetical protein